MNLWRRAVHRVGSFFASEDEAPRSPWDDFWYQSTGPVSATGLRVTPENAMQVSTVFACRKVISETLAMLPLIVYERTGENARRRAVDEPTYRLLHRAPNAWQTPYDFKECLTGWAALHGNGYAHKIFSRHGVVTSLIPVHPSLVRLELVSVSGRSLGRQPYDPDALMSRNDGEEIQLRYMVKQGDGSEKPFAQSEMLHIRGISFDGIGGVALSRQAREAIALAQAMEAFGARYFANDATVGMLLEHPGQLSEGAQKRLKDSWLAMGGVGNAFKPRILEEGMKATRLDAKARDAQLTEARASQVVEICRYFRMPPHKVQHLQDATFSNIEHQGIEFGTDTMQPWAVRWEQACTRDLIVDDEKYYAEVMMNALMRGDSAARSTYYREMFHIGTLSRNEIRASENQNPIDGGDKYYINAATVPLDSSGKPMVESTDNAGRSRSALPRSVDDVDDEEDEEDEEDGRAESFGVLLADAADRIALAETRELEKRASKRVENAEKFRAWAEDFYAAHEQYVFRVISPLARAWSALGGDAADIAGIASHVAATGLAAALDGATARDPKALAAQLTPHFILRSVQHAA